MVMAVTYIGLGIVLGVLYQYGLQWRCHWVQHHPRRVGLLVIVSVISFIGVGLAVGWLANQTPSLAIKRAGYMAVGLFISHVWGWAKLARQRH